MGRDAEARARLTAGEAGVEGFRPSSEGPYSGCSTGIKAHVHIHTLCYQHREDDRIYLRVSTKQASPSMVGFTSY